MESVRFFAGRRGDAEGRRRWEFCSEMQFDAVL